MSESGVLQGCQVYCLLAIKSNFDFLNSAASALFCKTEKNFLHNTYWRIQLNRLLMVVGLTWFVAINQRFLNLKKSDLHRGDLLLMNVPKTPL